MTSSKLTKIVATIGPSSETAEKISELIDAGVNVFRFNTKHSTPDWHDEHIKLVQQVADQKGAVVGILLDLQGPEIRLETRDKKEVLVNNGDEIKIGSSFVDGIDVIIPHSAVFSLLKKGDDLFIDDGFVETTIVSVHDHYLVTKVKNDAVIKHRKGVNLPGIDIDFPSLIDNDIKQIEKNARNKVDYVGLSFVRSAADVRLLRLEMQQRGMDAQIVAKIENQVALNHIDAIIAEADLVMVARGDLGIETAIEQLAYWQETIIRKCRLANKPVITATQMLESMIVNPRPTRAEATDVANAIYDGTDAIMLSAETAGGKYPVRTVQTMAKIAAWNESHRPVELLNFPTDTATSNITKSAVTIAKSDIAPPLDHIIVFTETGFTARSISRYRQSVPVIAVTGDKKVAESMTVSFGVTPFVTNYHEPFFTTPDKVLSELVEKGLIKKGENVIVVHGSQWQKAGLTNALQITTV
jgi:pyruvate kinase